jgi:hypothetical protein
LLKNVLFVSVTTAPVSTLSPPPQLLALAQLAPASLPRVSVRLDRVTRALLLTCITRTALLPLSVTGIANPPPSTVRFLVMTSVLVNTIDCPERLLPK